MQTRIAPGAVITIITLALVLCSCAGPSELPTGPGVTWDLVILGDSSLWDLGDAYAAQIESDVGVKVAVHNYTSTASSAGAVLEVLRTGDPYNLRLQQLPDVLRDAEVVVMFLNPSDSVNEERPLEVDGCFNRPYQPPASCDPETFRQWTADLEAIWAEIFRLRNGEPIILRATDLYSALVGPWAEAGVLEACTECWENISDAARLAAESHGIPFLSRLDAFNGPNHMEDPRMQGYINGDGEHLSTLGVQFTAELLSEMGYEPVVRP